MALTTFGTLTSFQTLKANTQTIAQFGEDRAWDGIASALNAWNRQVDQVMGDLVYKTTQRMLRYGGGGKSRPQRMDEMGTPNVQKTLQGSPVGFPLHAWGEALGWNRLYVLNRRTNEFAAQIQNLMTGDIQNMLREFKMAIFMGVNSNFVDYRVDQVSSMLPIPLKALLNADGAVIPPGPNGETFDPHTHTHYLATAVWTNSWLQGLLETVIEHFNEGQPMIVINRADESNVEALEDFKPLTYVQTRLSETQEYGVGNIDPLKLYNRQIGWFRGAQVWVKPWMIANYVFAYMANGPDKPVAMRIRGDQPDGGNALDGAGDFVITYEDERHPLRARGYEREFGMSVYNRANGAVGYIGGDGSKYVQPTIPAIGS
jgi:hypothetical protein